MFEKYLFLLAHILLYRYLYVIHQASKQLSSQVGSSTCTYNMYVGGAWFRPGLWHWLSWQFVMFFCLKAVAGIVSLHGHDYF